MLDLRNATAVVTGASSGVGRATAHAFARSGACVVLAARGEGPLRDTAAECAALGGRAIAVPTDTTDIDAVRHLVLAALDAFGRIDVWVNNAGVGAVGRFTDVPIEAHRRVIEANLLGYMYGAYAVLPHFMDQGRGTLINNISVGGYLPAPFAAAYAASKFGVRAFSDSLRQEVADWPDVHVSAVYPYFMDTPGVYHGANYTGRKLKPGPPLYAPETTANAIVDLAQRPRREIRVGMMTKLAVLEYALAPRLVEWTAGRVLELYLRNAQSAPITDGNLFRSMPRPMAVHGGWRRPAVRAGAVAALGLAGGAAAAALLSRR